MARKSAEELERDIRRTQERLEANRRNLGQQSPAALLAQQAFGIDAGNPADAVQALMQRAKGNRLAAMAIGAGLAGLLLSDDSRSGSNRSEPENTTAGPDVGERLSDAASAAAEAAKSGVARAGRRVASGVEQSAGEAVDAGKQAIGHIGDGLARTPSVARATAFDALDWVKSNPVTAGLVAVAAGAAVASIFTGRKPESRLKASRALHREAEREEWVGEPTSSRQKATDEQQDAEHADDPIKADESPASVVPISGRTPLKQGKALADKPA